MFPKPPTPTKVLFPKATPKRPLEVGEVALSQDEPLSVDLTMFPETPTATKVLFPKVTPSRLFAVGEMTLSKDEPLSVDLTMFPLLLTATNTPEPEEEVVVSSVVVVVVPEDIELLDDYSFSPQETTMRLKKNMRIMYKTLLIFFLFRN